MIEDLEENSKVNKSKNNITKDLYESVNKIKSFSIFGIIIFSFIFGSIGGFFGVLGAMKSPQLNKYFKFPISQNEDVKKTIILSEESSVIDVVKNSSPAVVSIIASKDIAKIPSFNPFFPFFEDVEDSRGSGEKQTVGAGSGFFVSEDGLILTNKHVVSDESAEYTVITNDSKEYQAKVVALDPRNDLAILKIDILGVRFLKLSDSSLAQIGQRVIAIGNSLGQYQNTVTTGIISGIGRSITAGGMDFVEQLEGVIQTDTAINPGNSGGPLLDVSGQVIGINTAVDRQGQLVGFAIPSNDAERALKSFREKGRIARPFIGIRYIMLSKALAEEEKLPTEFGALIVRGQKTTDFAVSPGSPADKAGLRENDIILEIDGVKLDGNKTLAGELKKKDVGDLINMKIYSKGEEKIIKLILAEAK